MTLTRKMLEAMSIEEKAIDQIIEAHTETVESLKQQRDKFQKEADKVEGLEKELAELQKAVNEDGYQAKYEAEHEAFEAFKKSVEDEKRAAEVEGKYRELLKEAGIDPKRVNTVMKVTDLSEIALNKDGSIQGAEKLKDQVKEEWSDFIIEVKTKGANVEDPLDKSKNAGGMTVEEIKAIQDPVERQQKMAENHELFGF